MPVAGAEEVPTRRGETAASWRGRLGNERLNIVVTGGHLDPPDDYLLTADGECALDYRASGSKRTRLMGRVAPFRAPCCAGWWLAIYPSAAAKRAKDYVTAAMRAAYPIGRGKGPMNHLFRLEAEGR